MGEGKLLAAAAALIACALPASAQGPVYRERWSYSYLEQLRDLVFVELQGRDAATRRRVGELLAAPARGRPFDVAARALASVRGVEADAAFRLRAGLGCFLLPEVVDPSGEKEVCRRLNATLFLPLEVEQPGQLAFSAVVRDGAGEVAFTGAVGRDVAVGDLRRARAELQVPGEGLGDGRYRVEIRALVDGEEPRAGDPVLARTFHVLRGYQARSEAAMTAVRELHTELGEPERALLLGLAAEVSRAYSGEAGDGASDAVADLLRLEQALANRAAGRHVLHGMTGDVATLVPAGGEPMRCVLRLDPERPPDAAAPARPLLVFADGAPAYDLTGRRPTAPATRGPRWLASALPEFGVADDFDVAFLDSPGGGRNYAAALPRALDSLRQLFGVGDRPVVLVCEREAASAVGLALPAVVPGLAGLVLVGAGAVPGPALQELGACRVRFATLVGHPGSAGLLRTHDYVVRERERGALAGEFERLCAEEPAWPFGTRSLAGPIRTFALEVFDR